MAWAWPRRQSGGGTHCAELAEEGQVDRIVRARLASYSRPVVEGSQEWDVLYRKAFEEESRKRKKA